MTYDPNVPARERTPYGNFQLHPTHLKTGTVVCRYSDPEELTLDEVTLLNARLVTAGHALNVNDAVLLFDYLGIG